MSDQNTTTTTKDATGTTTTPGGEVSGTKIEAPMNPAKAADDAGKKPEPKADVRAAGQLTLDGLAYDRPEGVTVEDDKKAEKLMDTAVANMIVPSNTPDPKGNKAEELSPVQDTPDAIIAQDEREEKLATANVKKVAPPTEIKMN